MSNNVWFTSDPHIGHRFIAAHRMCHEALVNEGDKQEAPDWFNATHVAQHDGWLASQWRKVVRPGDQVFVLGDTSSGTKPAALNAIEWYRDLPGIKHLVWGNHDPGHPGIYRDAHRWQPLFLSVFDTVNSFARRRVSLLEGGHTDLLLSHFPYQDQGIGTMGKKDRYLQYRLPNHGLAVAHGHTHSKSKITFAGDRPVESQAGVPFWPRPTLQLHVGVDAWDGALVPLDWIVSQVRTWHARLPMAEA
jgi:calcineurin-like phosphoesterase family protein